MKSERIKSLNWTSSSNFCREALLVLPAFIISKCLVFLAWILSKLLSGTFDPPNGERFDRGLMAWDGDWYASIGSISDRHIWLTPQSELLNSHDLVIGRNSEFVEGR